MVLDREFVFQVLSLNALLTATTETAVELVVVMLAIWLIVEDIELG